jgi:hypothetical protein
LPLDGAIQASNCLLSKSKLPIVKKQNDFIKDNIIDKEKDNNGEALTANAVKSSLSYPIVTVGELVRNGVEYELLEDSKDLIRIKATNKIVRVV